MFSGGGKIQMQSCPVCGGTVKHMHVEDEAIWGKYAIKVSGIEADVCDSCGERYYSVEDAEVLEKIAKALSESDSQPVTGDGTALLNLSETAKILRVSNQSIYNMIKDGRIKAAKVGREWRFRLAEIKSLLSSGSDLPLAARNSREISQHDKEIIEKLRGEEE